MSTPETRSARIPRWAIILIAVIVVAVLAVVLVPPLIGSANVLDLLNAIRPRG